MKKINPFFRIFLAFVTIFALLLINFSFTFSRKYIEVKGLDRADLGTSACMCVQLPGKEAISIRSEKNIRFYDVDSCRVGIRLPGYFNPNSEDGAPMYSHFPKRDMTVKFQLIEYVLPQPIRITESKNNNHKDFTLRFMAVSAPQWVSSGNISSSYALDSRTPFSLQNAVRLGARDALSGASIWSQSNWSQRHLLEDSVFLMNYFDEEKSVFTYKLISVKPQILFIGSMTLPFPGAIELAKIAKQKLGNNVFIVLGGKHAIETVYFSQGEINHHPGSPALLMQQGDIPQVFDLVVSGDGEEVIQKIGDVIGDDVLCGRNIQNFSVYQEYFKTLRGNFLLSWIDQGKIQTLKSQNKSLDYSSLTSPVSLFGVNSQFPVFGKEFTAHVYSDMGKGCLCNCFFCSEGSRINGPIIQSGSPARRLYQQLKDASEQNVSMSAFVEDSILLMGLPRHLNELANLLEERPLDIIFGGQFTVDNLLNPKIQEAIIRLKKLGLVYIYTGMETINEDMATQMSKNSDKKNSWLERTEKAVSFVSSLGLKHGLSILWGLGETQRNRSEQLNVISLWQTKYSNPVVVSPNWATQHPLFNQSTFNYVDWGTARKSPYLPYFIQLFGEASEEYQLANANLPTIEELKELRSKFTALNIQNV
ncbi:MAG: hypothetical protein WC467_02435 [Patescibacteria group bacterium]